MEKLFYKKKLIIFIKPGLLNNIV